MCYDMKLIMAQWQALRFWDKESCQYRSTATYLTALCRSSYLTQSLGGAAIYLVFRAHSVHGERWYCSNSLMIWAAIGVTLTVALQALFSTHPAQYEADILIGSENISSQWSIFCFLFEAVKEDKRATLHCIESWQQRLFLAKKSKNFWTTLLNKLRWICTGMVLWKGVS